MGYRIEYGSVRKVRRLEKRVSVRAAVAACCFLFFCLGVFAFWPEGADLLRRLVFPGDPAVTAAALEQLTIELHSGVNLTDSLRQFCIKVLEGAGVAAV